MDADDAREAEELLTTLDAELNDVQRGCWDCKQAFLIDLGICKKASSELAASARVDRIRQTWQSLDVAEDAEDCGFSSDFHQWNVERVQHAQIRERLYQLKEEEKQKSFIRSTTVTEEALTELERDLNNVRQACRACHKATSFHNCIRLPTPKHFEARVNRVKELVSNLALVEDDQECGFSKNYHDMSVWGAPHLDAYYGNARDNHGGHFNEPSHHDHTMHPAADPSVCDCPDGELADLHKETLQHIAKLEGLYRELTVANGVTQTIREQAVPIKEVHPSVPPGYSRVVLTAQTLAAVDSKLGEETLEMPEGRPLCLVFCPCIVFHCHWNKLRSYGTGSCNCNKQACNCTPCVLAHVKHSIADYEEAIARVRLGITKLRAQPRDKGADADIASLKTIDPPSGGCSMPGVRKAKHMKEYAKKQKDTYNQRG